MIGFRIDANEKVATGHMMRCISIAKKIRIAGEECIFFTAESSDAGPVEDNGFTLVRLPLKWDDWDADIPLLQQACTDNNVSLLVVDSYLVTENFFKKISETVSVFYLDDICEKAYPVKAVLHYSEWEGDGIIEKMYAGRDTLVFSGMWYVPLRDGFAASGTHNKYDILVTTGGSDVCHISLLLARSFLEDRWMDKKICMVLGRMNTDADEINEIAGKHGGMTVMQNITNMNEVLAESRTGVCAGGISVYEFMASGTPFTCFAFSDDQKIFGERLEEHSHCRYSGDARADAALVAENILDNLGKLLSMSDSERNALSLKNKNTVDGRGAERIAELILNLL